MAEFKEWYSDDGRVFNREFRAMFSQCTINHELSIQEMLRLTSDVAVEDYRIRGMSTAVLAEHNILILVSRMAVRFHRMPMADQIITLSTWEETPEPLQLKRGYLFSSDQGEPLVSSISTWLLVDPVVRRIIPTKKFTLRPDITYERPHDCMEPGKIQVPQELVPLNRRPVCFSDLDGNGHTNNSRYGAYTVDCLPPEYQQKTFTDFRINFAKEAMLGDMLQMYAAFDDAGRKITVVGRKVDSGETCFESELYY